MRGRVLGREGGWVVGGRVGGRERGWGREDCGLTFYALEYDSIARDDIMGNTATPSD